MHLDKLTIGFQALKIIYQDQWVRISGCIFQFICTVNCEM